MSVDPFITASGVDNYLPSPFSGNQSQKLKKAYQAVNQFVQKDVINTLDNVTLTSGSNGGQSLIKSGAPPDFVLKGLKAGSNITLTQDGSDITVAATGGGGGGGYVAGTGIDITAGTISNTGITHITAGTDVSVVYNTPTTVTISAAGGGGGSYVAGLGIAINSSTIANTLYSYPRTFMNLQTNPVTSQTFKAANSWHIVSWSNLFPGWAISNSPDWTYATPGITTAFQQFNNPAGGNSFIQCQRTALYNIHFSFLLSNTTTNCVWSYGIFHSADNGANWYAIPGSTGLERITDDQDYTVSRTCLGKFDSGEFVAFGISCTSTNGTRLGGANQGAADVSTGAPLAYNRATLTLTRASPDFV